MLYCTYDRRALQAALPPARPPRCGLCCAPLTRGFALKGVALQLEQSLMGSGNAARLPRWLG